MLDKVGEGSLPINGGVMRQLLGVVVLGLAACGSNAESFDSGAPDTAFEASVDVDLIDLGALDVGVLDGGIEESKWIPINPGGGGWFERIGVGPDGLAIACSDLGGAYFTRDHGETWAIIGPSDGLLATHIADAAFAPGEPTRILLATDGGIYLTDDGHHFRSVYEGGYIESVIFASETVAYAAWHPEWDQLSARILISNDGGASWRFVTGELPPDFRVIKLIGQGPLRIFALSGTARFAEGAPLAVRSEDGGDSWQPIPLPDGLDIIDLAIDPLNPDAIFTTGRDDPEGFGALFHSPDGGDDWSWITDHGGFIWPGPGAEIRLIDPEALYPWDDRGGVWSKQPNGDFEIISEVSDWPAGWSSASWVFTTSIRGIEYAPDRTEAYWVTNQFGWRVHDGGSGLQAKNMFTQRVGDGWTSSGLDNVVVVDLATGADPALLYAGFFDLGTWRSDDRGASWVPLNHAEATGGWEGAGGNTWSILADPIEPEAVWATQAESTDSPGSLLYSHDRGKTWQFGQDLPMGPMMGLSLATESPVERRVLFLTVDGDVWGSDDGGQRWSRRSEIGGVRWTAVHGVGEQLVVYAGGESGVWMSSPGGIGPWDSLELPHGSGAVEGPPDTWGWTGIFDLKWHAGHLFAVVFGPNGGLYEWDGDIWTHRLEDPHARRVAFDPQNERVYVTSSSVFEEGGALEESAGIWRSDDAGQSWQGITDNLAWPFAIPIAVASDSIIYIGSSGPGVHRRSN